MGKSQHAESEFRFKNNDRIGANDAEEDSTFLETCFVDNGDIEILSDMSRPERLIVGRTGIGKTALLRRLASIEERVIIVSPESLSVSYIANSTIIQYVAELGVNLDLFFRFLWRHVFTVQILQEKFGLKGQEKHSRGIIAQLMAKNSHKQAIKYLDEWGSTFWEETDYRVREITQSLEQKLQPAVGISLCGANFNVSGESTQKTEDRKEVINRAQQIVNSVQIRQLSDMLKVLDEILDNPQQKYIITMDDLDKNWVDSFIRYRLIRALIETIKDFRHVRNAKIFVVLRKDLLERVLRETRDEGFQEEKYISIYYHIRWSRESLIELLDARINELIQRRYTRKKLTHEDILPERIDGGSGIDYILTRTFNRPRDVIHFFNLCIKHSAGKPRVSVSNLRQAEGEYSRSRLNSICDEWAADYPNLERAAKLLERRPRRFSLSELTEAEMQDFATDLVVKGLTGTDQLVSMCCEFVDAKMNLDQFLARLFYDFYRFGLVGLKVSKREKFYWVSIDEASLSVARIDSGTSVEIHPAFHTCLGVLTN